MAITRSFAQPPPSATVLIYEEQEPAEATHAQGTIIPLAVGLIAAAHKSDAHH